MMTFDNDLLFLSYQFVVRMYLFPIFAHISPLEKLPLPFPFWSPKFYFLNQNHL